MASAKSQAAAHFKAEVCGRGAVCFFAGRGRAVKCSGPMDAAHLIPAQRLRAHTATLPEQARLDAVYDPRVAVPACRAHHHAFDHGFIKLFREDLPEAVFEYAKTWQIGWSLDRDYPSLEELRGVV